MPVAVMCSPCKIVADGLFQQESKGGLYPPFHYIFTTNKNTCTLLCLFFLHFIPVYSQTKAFEKATENPREFLASVPFHKIRSYRTSTK